MSVAPTANAIMAVAARRELRVELYTANLLGTLNFSRGTPTTCTMPRTRSGPSTTTPMNAISAAAVTMTGPIWFGPIARDNPTMAADARKASRPRTTRTRPVPFSNPAATALVRSAANGATRVARRAGTSADSTVTTVPTTSPVTTADGVTTTETVESPPMREPPKRAPSIPIPTPESTPRAEETRPTTSDSARTEPNTWERLAPTHRSRAISRWRWAMRMAKVL